jgi:hypothetical protein
MNDSDHRQFVGREKIHSDRNGGVQIAYEKKL